MTFSDYLSNFLLEKEFKWLTAAKLCDIDRQQLKRYTKGYIPKKIETVEKIADGLGMTQSEKDKLCRLFYKQKIGNDKYFTEFYINNIFCESFKKNRKINKKQENIEKWGEKQVKNIYDKDEIYNLIEYLVTNVTEINLKMNWYGKEEIFSEIFEQIDEKTKVRQIIEISSKKDIIYILKEFEIFESLFQLISDYQVYSFYRWGEIHNDNLEELNMIITDRGVLLFNNEINSAIYVNKGGYIDYYNELFLNMMNKVVVFGSSISKFNEKSFTTENIIKNKESRTIFAYMNNPKEAIYIKKKTDKEVIFCLEEMNLVNIFKEFIKSNKEIYKYVI